MIYGSNKLPLATYQQLLNHFRSVFPPVYGINLFFFQMRTDRGGLWKIVLEFSSLILADDYHTAFDEWTQSSRFQFQLHTEALIPLKTQIINSTYSSFQQSWHKFTTFVFSFFSIVPRQFCLGTSITKIATTSGFYLISLKSTKMKESCLVFSVWGLFHDHDLLNLSAFP